MKRIWYRRLDQGYDLLSDDGIKVIKRGEQNGWEAYSAEGVPLVEAETQAEIMAWIGENLPEQIR